MRRLFPSFVYTRPFGWLLLVAMSALVFRWCQVFHGFWFWAGAFAWSVSGGWLISELLDFSRGFLEEPKRNEPSPAPPRPLRSRAYLVLHFDITQSPPVVTFACIYSASAQDLTRFGREIKADLYRVEADTFAEAHDEMEQIVPLYFPWVVPLMTRNR